MRRIFILAYFLLWVAASSYWICTSFEYPLRVVLLETIVVVPIAISILFSGFCYKPKRFTWVWKIVPLMLLSAYVFDWYIGWGTSSPPERPLLYTILDGLVGSAMIFPAFYLPFRFAYSKTLPPPTKLSPKLIAVSLAMTAFCSFSDYIPYPQSDINVSDINVKVNYVAVYNKITRPVDYDPNQNAAPYYEKAFALVNAPNDIKDLSKKWPGDMNEAELNTLKKWLASNSETLDYLRQAAQKPYYWIERRAKDNNLLKIEYSELKKLKRCTQLLVLQAKLMASQGQIEPALKQVAEIYKIGTHFGPPKTLLDQLVGIAISANALNAGFQILDRTKPNPDLLKTFQEEIKKLSASRNPIIDLTAERMMFYDQVQRLFTDDGQGDGHVYGTAFLEDPPGYLRRLFNPEKSSWTKTSRKKTIELADKMYDHFEWARDKSPARLHKEGKDIDKTAEEMVKNNYLLKLLRPAIGRVLKISYRLKIHTDSLLVTTAILRYRADRGYYPSKLNDLVHDGYLEKIPIDPFSGNSLIYRLTDDNFVLYGFGHDLDDDGGTYSRKWGEGEEGGDMVFWPVERY